MVIEEEGFPPLSCVSRKFTGRRIDKSGVRVQLLVPLSIFSSTRYQRCPNLRPRCIYCYLICLPSPLFASTIKSFYYTFYPAFITLKLTPSSPSLPRVVTLPRATSFFFQTNFSRREEKYRSKGNSKLWNDYFWNFTGEEITVNNRPITNRIEEGSEEERLHPIRIGRNLRSRVVHVIKPNKLSRGETILSSTVKSPIFYRILALVRYIYIYINIRWTINRERKNRERKERVWAA